MRLRTDSSGYEVDQKTSAHRQDALAQDLARVRQQHGTASEAVAAIDLRVEESLAEKSRVHQEATEAQQAIADLTREFREAQRKQQEYDRALAQRTARLRLAFDPSLPRSVVKDGVYRFMRHPFYTSYVLFWIGWAIAAWSIWALAALIVVVAIYVWAARMEERNFARSELAEEYDTYRRQTGVFGRRSLLK